MPSTAADSMAVRAANTRMWPTLPSARSANREPTRNPA